MVRIKSGRTAERDSVRNRLPLSRLESCLTYTLNKDAGKLVLVA
jgi:hypothetical protein